MATHTVSKSGKKLGAALSGITSEVDVQSELVIEILPRGHATWHGTAAQLVAEGVLPKGFAWPDDSSAAWEQDGYEFWLMRARPSHITHREWRASARDHWRLRRSIKISNGCFYDEARLFDKQHALNQELWSRTPAGAIQKHQLARAVEDNRFQKFLALVGATPARYSIR